MKIFLICLSLVAAIIAGYLYVSKQHELKVVHEQHEREQQIMQQQKQFQDQTTALGKQMQQDLESRMEPVDSADN